MSAQASNDPSQEDLEVTLSQNNQMQGHMHIADKLQQAKTLGQQGKFEEAVDLYRSAITSLVALLKSL